MMIFLAVTGGPFGSSAADVDVEREAKSEDVEQQDHDERAGHERRDADVRVPAGGPG
jgi:hypothetical protein